jgi:hypothetical protein
VTPLVPRSASGFRVAYTKHHVITELRQLVDVKTTLGPDFNVADFFHMLFQRFKEGRIDNEFFFLSHAAAHPLLQVKSCCGSAGVFEFDRRMKRLKQHEIADIAHENMAAGLDTSGSAFKNTQEVFNARKVLNDGVEDDGIE